MNLYHWSFFYVLIFFIIYIYYQLIYQRYFNIYFLYILGIVGSLICDSALSSPNEELTEATVEIVLETLNQSTLSECEVLHGLQLLNLHRTPVTDTTIQEYGGAIPSATNTVEHSPSNVAELGEFRSKLSGLHHWMRAKRVCLELITNIASGISDTDSGDGWEDCSETSENGSVESMETASAPVVDDMELATTSGEENATSWSMYSSLVTKDVIKVVLNLSCPAILEDEDPSRSNDPSAVVHLLSCRQTQIAALICVGNIVETTPVEILGGLDMLECTWLRLSRMTSAKLVVTNADLLEATMNALRAVACRLQSVGSAKLSEVRNNLLLVYPHTHTHAQTDTQTHMQYTYCGTQHIYTQTHTCMLNTLSIFYCFFRSEYVGNFSNKFILHMFLLIQNIVVVQVLLLYMNMTYNLVFTPLHLLYQPPGLTFTFVLLSPFHLITVLKSHLVTSSKVILFYYALTTKCNSVTEHSLNYI